MAFHSHTIKLLWVVAFSILVESLMAQAPTIKRQVISALGTNHVQYGNGGCTAITVGQPPNSGTLTGGNVILRQGFQQPSNDKCPIVIAYSVSEIVIPLCGTYYVFEYTGDINPNTTVSWNFGVNSFPNIVSAPVTPQIAFAASGVQPFTITVSDGTCEKSISASVNVAKAPFMVTNSVVNALCFGDFGTINLNPINGLAPYAYIWGNGATTQALTQLRPGTYTYTVTDNNGCSASQSATVTGSTTPLFLVSKVLDETCNDAKDGEIEVFIQNGIQPISYTWSDGSSESNRMGLSTGKYGLVIEDANGCKLDSVFQVRLYCELNEEDFIPSVFSPNSDGFNDLWTVPMLDRFPEHQVSIYNRWGNVIWEASGDFAGWNGTNQKGEEMPLAAYFYIIELNNATKKVFKGSTTLIR